MEIILKTGNKRRILTDGSLNGDELEAVYPKTVIEDVEKLSKITDEYIEKNLTPEEALERLKKSFDDGES
jgi:hypothetical protein